MSTTDTEKLIRTQRPCRNNIKAQITNNSDLRYKRPRLEFYKNHGDYILIPKSKRLNWNDVTKLETALTRNRGK